MNMKIQTMNIDFYSNQYLLYEFKKVCLICNYRFQFRFNFFDSTVTFLVLFYMNTLRLKENKICRK